MRRNRRSRPAWWTCAGRGSIHADEADVALSKADDAVGEQHIIRADRRVALCCGVSRRVVAVFAQLVAQIALRNLDIAELRGRALYDISAAVCKLRNEVRDSVGVCHGRVRQSARHARGQGVDLLLERGDLRGKRLFVLTSVSIWLFSSLILPPRDINRTKNSRAITKNARTAPQSAAR